MIRHAEPQPAIAREPCPGADDVLLRADVDGVPGVVRGVVGVEVVVMIRERDEILGAGLQ